MQYIWEVVLAAEKNGIREADLQYEVPEVRSPYLEVSFYDLNTQTVEQTAVEVNPFYRFFDIFSGVLDLGGRQRRLYSYFHPMKKNILYWRSWMSYLLVTIVRFSSGCFKRYIKTLLYIKAWIVPMNFIFTLEVQKRRKKGKGFNFY